MRNWELNPWIGLCSEFFVAGFLIFVGNGLDRSAGEKTHSIKFIAQDI